MCGYYSECVSAGDKNNLWIRAPQRHVAAAEISVGLNATQSGGAAAVGRAIRVVLLRYLQQILPGGDLACRVLLPSNPFWGFVS